MKINKLPDKIDPVTIIKKNIDKKFRVCPFCGEAREYSLLKNSYGIEKINYYPPKGWHGPAKGDIFGWFIPSRWHYWRIESYRCHTCGAEWESDPYPIDITGL